MRKSQIWTLVPIFPLTLISQQDLFLWENCVSLIVITRNRSDYDWDMVKNHSQSIIDDLILNQLNTCVCSEKIVDYLDRVLLVMVPYQDNWEYGLSTKTK